MVPNNIIFEESIINYSYRDDFVLGEVLVTVTYESDLDKAIKSALEIATKHTSILFEKEMVHISKKEPFVRLKMADSGINIRVRYFVPYLKMQEAKTRIIKDILETFAKDKDVDIAYPHTEIIFKDKKFGISQNKK